MRFTAFCRQVFGCKGFLLNGTKLDLTKIPPLPPNELAVEWSDYLKASKTALLQINQAFNISFIVKEISNWSREGAQFVWLRKWAFHKSCLRPWSSMPVMENSSLLFSSSHLGLLFWKMVDFLFVILTNNKQKIHYFPKYQALDD